MIEVRLAHQGDAPKVRALLGQLGYDVPVEDVRKRVADLTERHTDAVLLAAEADVTVGPIAVPCSQESLSVLRDAHRLSALNRPRKLAWALERAIRNAIAAMVTTPRARILAANGGCAFPSVSRFFGLAILNSPTWREINVRPNVLHSGIQNTASGCSTGTRSRLTTVLSLSLRTTTNSSVSLALRSPPDGGQKARNRRNRRAPHFRCEFEPLPPTDLGAAFHGIHDNLVTAMVMRPCYRIWLIGDGANPGLRSLRSGEIERGGASGSGRGAHGPIE
jgi:hypothetical protein